LNSLTTWLPLRARTGKCIKPTLGNWTRNSRKKSVDAPQAPRRIVVKQGKTGRKPGRQAQGNELRECFAFEGSKPFYNIRKGKHKASPKDDFPFPYIDVLPEQGYKKLSIFQSASQAGQSREPISLSTLATLI
jgi:hypothetical protein